jgi:hypothetical protein
MRTEIIEKYGYHNETLERYIVLIETNLQTPKTELTESHHIFLKSIFGDNKIVVNLSILDHLLAHYYLYLSIKYFY